MNHWREALAADYGVIGDPVGHSLSPQMHTAAYATLNLQLTYRSIRVPLEEFGDAIDHLIKLGYRGLNVTTPLKRVALEWCEWTNAERYGAVNTLDLEHRGGINTDAPGFLETLSVAQVKPGNVLVLGAGGSARAVCVALHETGFTLKLHNRTRQNAETMLGEANLEAEVLDLPDPEACSLVVNTTSAGLNGETTDLIWDNLSHGALVYDLYYTKGLTPFLSEAEARGHRTMDGRSMLVSQGALSLEWWTGYKAPRDVMMDAIL